MAPEDEQDDALPADDAADDAADESLPGANEQQRAEMADGHGEVLESLTPETSPEANFDQWNEDNAQVMDDLTPRIPEVQQAPAARQETINETPRPATTSDDKPGRYYVPPNQRTPENREFRRQEHDRIAREMSGQEPPAQSPPDFPEEDDAGGGGLENAMRAFTQSNHNALDRLADIVLDAQHRIDEILARLERGRL